MPVETPIEFRTHYVRGFLLYIILFAVATMSTTGIWTSWLLLKLGLYWVIPIFILIALYPLILVLFLKSCRVLIGPDYIEHVNIFRRKKIFIRDVKTFGLFLRSRYSAPRVTDQWTIDKYNDDEIFNHQIFLTVSPVFDLASFRPKKHLNFRYRRDVYFMIKGMLEKRDAKDPDL